MLAFGIIGRSGEKMKDKKKTDPLVSTKVLLKPRFHYLLVNA